MNSRSIDTQSVNIVKTQVTKIIPQSTLINTKKLIHKSYFVQRHFQIQFVSRLDFDFDLKVQFTQRSKTYSNTAEIWMCWWRKFACVRLNHLNLKTGDQLNQVNF